MKTFLALVFIQLALFVQRTNQLKRDERADDGFVEDGYFQDICVTEFSNTRTDLSNILERTKPPIKYMYPCENCKFHSTDSTHFKILLKRAKMFYKYDQKTDFFETKAADEFSYRYDCECLLDADDARIGQAIAAFKKDHLDSNCDKKDAAKEKSFEVDAAKVKACFQTKQKGGKAIIAVHQKERQVNIFRQEILHKPGDTVTFEILQVSVEPQPTPTLTRREPDGLEAEDQQLAHCLKDANFFGALSYSFIDYIFKCGKNSGQMYFEERNYPYSSSCRYEYDPEE